MCTLYLDFRQNERVIHRKRENQKTGKRDRNGIFIRPCFRQKKMRTITRGFEKNTFRLKTPNNSYTLITQHETIAEIQ